MDSASEANQRQRRVEDGAHDGLNSELPRCDGPGLAGGRTLGAGSAAWTQTRRGWASPSYAVARVGSLVAKDLRSILAKDFHYI